MTARDVRPLSQNVLKESEMNLLSQELARARHEHRVHDAVNRQRVATVLAARRAARRAAQAEARARRAAAAASHAAHVAAQAW